MPEEFNEILKENQDQNSMNIPFVIYADIESLLEKIKHVKTIYKDNLQ